MKWILLVIFVPSIVISQEGKYQGEINVNGNTLEVFFELTKNKEWNGSMDIPVQGAKGLKLTDIRVTKDSLLFNLDIPGGAGVASLIKGDSLVGIFLQGGARLPFFAVLKDDSEKIASKIERLKVLIDSLRDTLNVPGVSVGIIYRGDIILNNGFGKRDIKNNQPVDENTVFAIGSSSKAFTAAMVATAIDADSIKWDEPVHYHIPGFGMKDEFANNQINSIDLLTHRSGLPRHDLLWYGSSFTRQQLIEKIRYLEPTEPFRTTFQYQNLMYMTAGVLVGNIYKSTWENELQRQLLDPLGMTSTGCHLKSIEGQPNAALPYQSKEGELVLMPYRNIDAIGPAGSINSTSTDMLKWVAMLLNNGKVGDVEVLSEDVIKGIFKPRVPISGSSSQKDLTPFTYGLGWFINYYKGHRIVKHGGNIDGFSALVFMMPEDELGIVVLTNKNGTGFGDLIAMYAADDLLELDDINWLDILYPNGLAYSPEEEETAPKVDKPKGPYRELGAYAGKYTNEIFGTITIKHDKSGLHMKTDAFEFEMRHYDQEIFAIRDIQNDSWDKVIFRTDVTGQISYLEFILEAQLDPYKFVREADDEFHQKEYLDEFAGVYDLEGIKITITVAEGNLEADVTGQGKVHLYPVNKDIFSLKEVKGYQMEFIRNKKGKVIEMISHQPNGDFKAVREE